MFVYDRLEGFGRLTQSLVKEELEYWQSYGRIFEQPVTEA